MSIWFSLKETKQIVFNQFKVIYINILNKKLMFENSWALVS